MNYWFLLTPLLSALTGWFIHILAIRFFLYRILPKKKDALATSIGQLAAQQFEQLPGLEEKINDPKNLEQVLPVIETHVDRFLNEKLKEEMPMISMFIGNKTTDKFKQVFMREIQVLFPQVIGQFAGNLKAGLEIGPLVTRKINELPSGYLSVQVRLRMAKELRAIGLLGAFSGLVIGLLMVLITVLTS